MSDTLESSKPVHKNSEENLVFSSHTLYKSFFYSLKNIPINA